MVRGQSKIATKVYPWHDLAWDLALADRMDPASIERRFDALEAKVVDDENYWQETVSIQDAINTEIGTHLLRDILEGKVPVRKPNGNPLHGDPKLFKRHGPDTPHLTVDVGNAWLKKNRYLQVWAPDDSNKTNEVLDMRTDTPASAEPEHVKKAQVDRSWVMKKAALIKKHLGQWPTISRDFQDASTNGLSKAAKAPGHGDWFENDALIWARQRGKLNETTGLQAALPAAPVSVFTHHIKH